MHDFGFLNGRFVYCWSRRKWRVQSLAQQRGLRGVLSQLNSIKIKIREGVENFEGTCPILGGGGSTPIPKKSLSAKSTF